MPENNRLTGWDKGSPYVRECFERTEGGCEDMDTSRCTRCEHNLDTVRCLAQYEDSGLSPNRVAELLKKLTEAISGQLDSDITLGDIYGHVVCGDLLSALDKLAEYESTGLSPEEINSLNDFEHSQLAKLLAENSRLRAELAGKTVEEGS